jgi:hypothetical protein
MSGVDFLSILQYISSRVDLTDLELVAVIAHKAWLQRNRIIFPLGVWWNVPEWSFRSFVRQWLPLLSPFVLRSYCSFLGKGTGGVDKTQLGCCNGSPKWSYRCGSGCPGLKGVRCRFLCVISCLISRILL